eukprot:scaffold335490_cov39-Prasinocladus_malaysianus.AAC.1
MGQSEATNRKIETAWQQSNLAACIPSGNPNMMFGGSQRLADPGLFEAPHSLAVVEPHHTLSGCVE